MTVLRLSRPIRHAILVALYQRDVVADPDPASLEAAVEEVEAAAGDRRRGLEIAETVWNARDRLDRLLAPLTSEWPLHRQPVMDRNILRLACWEIRDAGIDMPVAISEAVELAKEYGTERSPAFVNGVLAALVRGSTEAVPAPAAPDAGI